MKLARAAGREDVQARLGGCGAATHNLFKYLNHVAHLVGVGRLGCIILFLYVLYFDVLYSEYMHSTYCRAPPGASNKDMVCTYTCHEHDGAR